MFIITYLNNYNEDVFVLKILKYNIGLINNHIYIYEIILNYFYIN